MVNFFRRGRQHKYSKISYSQCGEDLMIRFIFEQIKIKNPSYLDIGAHHPYYLSNTALFYMAGSRGVNIEPDPSLFKEFIRHRKKDVNLNIGITYKEDLVDFFIMSTPTMNTFSYKNAQELVEKYHFKIVKKLQIRTLSLNDVIRESCEGRFPDFLNIDAEGIDDEIVESLMNSPELPKVICVETLSYSEEGMGIKNNLLIEKVSRLGYFLYGDTYINSIFVLKDAW